MKVELTIDRTKERPKDSVPTLEKELRKRLSNRDENCTLTIRRFGSDGVGVFGGDKDDKKKIEKILQATWESAVD